MRVRLRLRSQLLIGVVIYLALVIGVGVTGLYLAVTSLAGMHESVEHYVHEVSVVGQIAVEINAMQSSVLAHVLSDSVEEEAQREREIARIERRVNTLLDDLVMTQQRFGDTADLESIGAFRTAWDEFVRVQDSQFLPLSRQDREQEEHLFVQANGPLGESFAAVRRELRVLQSMLPNESSQELREAEDGFSRTRNLLIGVILVAGALGAGLGLTQASRLARAIEELSRGARRVAGGNLSQPVRVQTGDELELLADSFNAMTDSLRAVERMQNEFVSMVSHELRTPMNAVIGMTDLLLRLGLGAQEREYVQAVHRSGETLLAVINDILDFSRLQAGRFGLQPAPLDVRGVVEDVTLLLAEGAQRKSLDLLCLVEPSLPAELIGDGHRLRQILMNLVGNAIKFTHHGEVVVRATTTEQADDSLLVRFDVTDTGIGVSDEARPKLFRPFSQGDGSTARGYGGTGLGLAISKKLAEAMGGAIGVDSVPGQGSTFWFTARFGRTGTAASRPTTIEGLGEARALVVADSPSRRQVLAEQLAGLGLHVDVAASGAEAVERAAAGRVVLVQDKLPNVDAEWLAQRLSDTARVVALIPLGRTQRAEALAAAGAVVLEHPARQARLIEALGGAISEPSPLDKAREAPRATRGRGGRVLVADDNPFSRQVAAAMLSHLGYAVDLASNGREALDMAGAADYTAILMDCQMPELDGFEAAAAIRQRESEKQHVPIVALTAAASSTDRERCLAAGMDDFLAKPIRTELLDRVLRRSLGVAPEPEPEPEPRPAPETPTPAAAEGPIDFDALAMLRAQVAPYTADGEDVLRQMIGLFEEAVAPQLDALRAAAVAGDTTGLRRAAHSVRGSGATIGAREVRRLAQQLEALGQSDDQQSIAGALALVEQLEAAVRRASAALAAAPV